MKKQNPLRSGVLALIALGLAVPALAESGSPVIQNEYAKIQTQFENQLLAAKKKLHDLESQKEHAIQQAKALATTDMEGDAALKKYWTLILNRYASEDGKFLGWTPINAKDVENINNLFETYLQSKPLRGRVSAGSADRTLDWGMGRLEELAKLHNSPKPENNSDLEIVTHQIKDLETSIKSITAGADRLGLKLNAKEAPEENAQAQGTLPQEASMVIGN